jgi:hypothetical protein
MKEMNDNCENKCLWFVGVGLFFIVDRRNDKSLETHTMWRDHGSNPGHGVNTSNFGIGTSV